MCKNKEELNRLVAKRMKLKALNKKIEDKLDDIDAEIIAYAKAKGAPGGKDNKTLIIYGDNYKVSLIEITKLTPDSDKLKTIFGADYDSILKASTYPRLDIR